MYVEHTHAYVEVNKNKFAKQKNDSYIRGKYRGRGEGRKRNGRG